MESSIVSENVYLTSALEVDPIISLPSLINTQLSLESEVQLEET